MNKNSVKYLLGIDGGGTKTEFLLTDIECKEIDRVLLGGSNPINVGIENTIAVLSDGIKKISANIDFSETVVFAGVAGIKTGNFAELINDFLSEYSFVGYSCSSDVELALESALKDEDGTVLIMGTGIAAFSRSGEKLYRTGGRGYLIDKGGSGFHFGSDALNAAFEFIDGRGGSKIIFELVEKKLGCSIEKGIVDVYKGGAASVAAFAPVVFEAAELQDEKALEIIEKNAKEAAAVINGASNLSGLINKKVAICGGLSKHKEILCKYISRYLQKDVELVFVDMPMVEAAVSLAKKLSGV